MNWRRKLTEEEKRTILSTTTIQINREKTLTNYAPSQVKEPEENEEVAKPYIPTFLGEVPEQLEDETQIRTVYQKPVDLTDKKVFPTLGGKRKRSSVVPDSTPTPSSTPVLTGNWLNMARKGEEEARIREERERAEKEELRRIQAEEAKNRPPPPPQRQVLYEDEDDYDDYEDEEYYSSESSDY